MSHRIGARVAISGATTPDAVVAAFRAGLARIKAEAARTGATPVWDTVTVETESDFFDDSTFVSYSSPQEQRSLRIDVLTVAAAEVTG